MQNLLSSGQRPDGLARLGGRRPGGPIRTECTITLLDTQERAVCELQAELRAHGITADVPELVSAMVEALLSRPSLCRGLIAAYLIEPGA